MIVWVQIALEWDKQGLLSWHTVLFTMLDSITICFIVQVMTVLKVSFQSSKSSALHQGAIKDAVLVVDKLTFHW